MRKISATVESSIASVSLPGAPRCRVFLIRWTTWLRKSLFGLASILTRTWLASIPALVTMLSSLALVLCSIGVDLLAMVVLPTSVRFLRTLLLVGTSLLVLMIM